VKLPQLDPRQLLRGLALIATLLVIGWAMERFGVSRILDTGWVDGQVRGQGAAGLGLFLLVAAIAVAVGVPRLAVSFLAGYAAGLIMGTALALVASIIGSALAFFYARLIGRDFVRRYLGTRAKRVDEFLGRNSFATIVAIRFLPVGNNLLTNLVAGISAVPTAAFLLGSAVGFVPQTIVFVLLGSGIRVDPPLRIGLSVALFLASAVLGAMIYRRRRAAEPDVD
jgi:uncharacterized membrane protein YdjX (TVP38/TMEM64 family)